MVLKQIIFFTLFTLIFSQCFENCEQCSNFNQCITCKKGYKLQKQATQCIEDNNIGLVIGVAIGSFAGVIICTLLAFCLPQSSRCYWRLCFGCESPKIDPQVNQYGLPPNNFQAGFIAQQIAHGVPIENPNNFATTNQFLLSPTPQPITAPMMMTNMITSPFRNFNTERDTCTICLSTGTNIQLLPCTHQFHSQCISSWCNGRRACPNCNATNFRLRVLCSRCFQFNEQVTLCPVGCQKPNHNQCFMMRNQNRLICRNCTSGVGARVYR